MRRAPSLTPAQIAERSRRATAARQAAIASTRPTTRPGSESTDLAVGDRVRVRRETVSSGTWARYKGRKGWVSAVNRQTFPDGRTYVEVGVSWVQPTIARNPSTDVWFRADELEPVASRGDVYRQRFGDAEDGGEALEASA